MTDRPIVAVFGSSKISPSDQEYLQALELGRFIATAGFNVMTGGYHGAMEAVSRGAKEGGGSTIGLTVELFDGDKPNKWIDRELRTKTLYTRLETFISLASAFVAVRGGIGTLAEITLTWNLLLLKAIPNKPLILFGEAWDEVLTVLQTQLYVSREHASLIRTARFPDDVLRIIREFEANRL